MLDSEDTHEQNVRERIERDGLEAEIARQADVERLKPHIEAFYEHGSRADVVGLCQAFESLERREFSARDLHRACLIEEISGIRSHCSLARFLEKLIAPFSAKVSHS